MPSDTDTVLMWVPTFSEHPHNILMPMANISLTIIRARLQSGSIALSLYLLSLDFSTVLEAILLPHYSNTSHIDLVFQFGSGIRIERILSG